MPTCFGGLRDGFASRVPYVRGFGGEPHDDGHDECAPDVNVNGSGELHGGEHAVCGLDDVRRSCVQGGKLYEPCGPHFAPGFLMSDGFACVMNAAPVWNDWLTDFFSLDDFGVQYAADEISSPASIVHA